MLISPRETIAECVEKINEEYFYIPAHQTIYTVLVELWNAGQAIDLITFTQVLRDRECARDGRRRGIRHQPVHLRPDSRERGLLPRDRSRQIHSAPDHRSPAPKACGALTKSRTKLDNLLDEVEQKIFAVGEDRFKGQMLTMKDQVMDAIESIEKLYERRGGITGILDRFCRTRSHDERIASSGDDRDRRRGRAWERRRFAMNIAEHVAVNEKLPVAVFSLEMSSQQLVQRLLCSRARVNLQKSARRLSGASAIFPSLTAAASKLAEAQNLHRRQRRA